MDKYYIFYVDAQGHAVYERTCGDEDAAKERVKYLKSLYADALFFKGDIPKDFKYFY